MARRADDLTSDPAVVVIEEPSESFDAWLHELQQGEPLDLTVTAAELLAGARAEDG
ncbi:MAG TPA: hypothetical protein VMM60_03435 [Ilumatobacter sp.]|nr:hypothetical protein [Ilumatobacter sp.]